MKNGFFKANEGDPKIVRQLVTLMRVPDRIFEIDIEGGELQRISMMFFFLKKASFYAISIENLHILIMRNKKTILSFTMNF